MTFRRQELCFSVPADTRTDLIRAKNPNLKACCGGLMSHTSMRMSEHALAWAWAVSDLLEVLTPARPALHVPRDSCNLRHIEVHTKNSAQRHKFHILALRRSC